MQTISQLLQARAEDSANRVFCRFNGKDTTFAQLHSGVTELAGALIEAGVTPGSRIGFMMSSSIEHIQLYLATSWLGATAVPFSIHFKSAGLELQLASSKPQVLIASRAHADAIHMALRAVQQPPKVIWFEPGNASEGEYSLSALLRSSRTASAAPRNLDDPVSINYTSGTTGAPKGVVMSERFYWVGAKNAGVLAGANREDTFFMWEPFYHVAAWMTVMMALQHGLRIYMVERFSASKLWDQIADAKATKFHYLGGLVNIMLSQPVVEAEKNNSISIAWGAACPTDSWRKFEERFGLSVREGYGISEGQNFTHINLDGVVGSIGRPVEEFESWIADENGKPVAPGATGEIVLKQKTPNVIMSGYFGEPQKTADVIRADGYVYTGDLASQDKDGYYYFKGRKKDALRRRGENISAWEVERVINAAPGVEESAVIGVASELGEQEILAVIKLHSGVNGNEMDILKFCEERLTYYQIPRYIQFVDEFPRGPTQRIKKGEISTDVSSAWDSEKVGYKAKRTA